VIQSRSNCVNRSDTGEIRIAAAESRKVIMPPLDQVPGEFGYNYDLASIDQIQSGRQGNDHPENGHPGRLRIAVVGSGISGLSAAWLLSKRHDVTLYEQEARPGGHANTVDVATAEGNVAVDTGFIVFNDVTYPNFRALLDHLRVGTHCSDMSFAASLDDGSFEYSGTNLAGLFAQRRNLLRPRLWRMVLSILRFYREAPARIAGGDADHLSLGAYLSAEKYDRAFIEDHLLPMAGAIWSTAPESMLAYPLHAFLRFCENHGLLRMTDRPVWRTVDGGSRNYVQRILDQIGRCAILPVQVKEIRRSTAGPEVIDIHDRRRQFDQVILATHADQALALLEAPTAMERRLLSAFPYQRNRAVLHTDVRLMPKCRRAWSSWNFIGGGGQSDQVCVTYWMNRLQCLATNADIFVTLNPVQEPRREMIFGEYDYSHPLFDYGAIEAQKRLWDLQGVGGIWYCGAYFGAGFHEDGLQAGLAVAEALGGVRRPWIVQDESGRIHLPAGTPVTASAAA
jgi:predicted NAD/FAD-binding protein